MSVNEVLTLPNKIKSQILVFIIKEGDTFVSYCPALELSSYGDTSEESHKAFEDALDIFLNFATEKGTLEKELLNLGWILQKSPVPIYIAPAPNSDIINKAIHSFEEIVAIPI